jgi:hypothetical protein
VSVIGIQGVSLSNSKQRDAAPFLFAVLHIPQSRERLVLTSVIRRLSDYKEGSFSQADRQIEQTEREKHRAGRLSIGDR